MITCPNCDGDGGWEVVEGPACKWGDPTPGGRWVECRECAGCGWVAGIPPSIDLDELPVPPDDGEQR